MIIVVGDIVVDNDVVVGGGHCWLIIFSFMTYNVVQIVILCV